MRREGNEHMLINQNDKVFVIRYNDNYVKDAMKYHVEICENKGFCWYGKAGKKPNLERLRDYINVGETKIVFYNRKAIYMGVLLEVSEEAPSHDYPQYYNESMWRPNSWYKVSLLERISDSCLEYLTVESSGNALKDTINRSMTSFYFTEVNEFITCGGTKDA